MDQPVETWTVRINADLTDLNQQLNAGASAGRQFSRSLITAFQGVAVQGKSVTDTLRALATNLSRITLQAAFRPLEQAAGGLLQGLLGGTFGTAGRAPSGALPVPFAAGGVISSPIAFPLRGGSTGVAGERGAEAIMPLARGADGRLGVKADGVERNISLTFNVTTPDAESFRRTQSQIAAMVGRALAQGQRNM